MEKEKTNEGEDENQEVLEQEPGEVQTNDVLVDTYLKTIILEETPPTPPFKEIKDNPLKLNQIGVSFEFNKIKYCDKIKKRKEYLNTNRVTEMTGTAYLIFNVGGKKITVQVSDDNDITWVQGRTENMNPPTPIKDEIKKIWNNPDQGFGLIGLGVKKLAGAAQRNVLGSVGSSKISDEDLECKFNDEYSIQNSKDIAPKEKKNKKGGYNIALGKIKKELENKCSGIEWEVEIKEKNYECTAKIDDNNLFKILFTLK